MHDYYETQILDSAETAWGHSLEVLAVRGDIAAREAVRDHCEQNQDCIGSNLKVRVRLCADGCEPSPWREHIYTTWVKIMVDEPRSATEEG